MNKNQINLSNILTEDLIKELELRGYNVKITKEATATQENKDSDTINIDKKTIYSDLIERKDKITKKEMIEIAKQFGIEKLRGKTRIEMFDNLQGIIYQSNWIDTMGIEFGRRD